MLSDSERYQKTKITKRKANEKFARYSDAQKLEAAKLWLLVGNNTVTAATLGINLETLMYWKTQRWWKELIEDLRHESSIKLSNRLKSIAEKSFALVEDRIDNGDFIYDQKSGKMVRKPMLGKDAARIASDFVDKAIRLEEKPREEEAAVVGRLEDLAKRFEELAAKKQPIQVTDVITIEQ